MPIRSGPYWVKARREWSVAYGFRCSCGPSSRFLTSSESFRGAACRASANVVDKVRECLEQAWTGTAA